jgi:hypothetical protein
MLTPLYRNEINIPRSQRGAVLAIGLLLLIGITVIAVATMSSSHMQERMAGNARTQAIAFEAASAASADAIRFFISQRAAVDADPLFGPCMEAGHPGWRIDPANIDPNGGDYRRTAWVRNGILEDSFDADVSIQQRLYCLEGPIRSQLFVLSRGEVLSGGTVVATRDIEVRLDQGQTGGTTEGDGDGCGALCFPGCNPGTLNFPTSDPFTVDGGPDQAAITVGCEAWINALLPTGGKGGPPKSGIWSSKVGSYVGGDLGPPSIAYDDDGLGSPWDAETGVEAFRSLVQASAAQSQLDGCPNCYFGAAHTDNGNTTYGTAEAPQITYIDGNANMGGNITGAGILFVNGTLNWNGTPAFQGIIVVLGGSYSVSGGGQGGIPQGGSIVVLNAPGGDPPAAFGTTNLAFTGGGTADYVYDCDALWAAHALLPEGQSIWTPNCERDATGPDSPFWLGPDELTIVSWRENIGWREELFQGN